MLSVVLTIAFLLRSAALSAGVNRMYTFCVLEIEYITMKNVY